MFIQSNNCITLTASSMTHGFWSPVVVPHPLQTPSQDQHPGQDQFIRLGRVLLSESYQAAKQFVLEGYCAPPIALSPPSRLLPI